MVQRVPLVDKVLQRIIFLNQNMFIVQLKMDRFVTRKRKPDEIDESESSGATASAE